MKTADSSNGKVDPNPFADGTRDGLQWGMSEDEAAWRAAGRRRFEEAYAVDDSVYESVIEVGSTAWMRSSDLSDLADPHGL
jgi:hypothetical protein